MKNKRMASFLASLAALLFASPALAHHGFAGRYDEDHPVTVMGTVVEIQFVNPHSMIFFDVTDKTGKTGGGRPNWGQRGSCITQRGGTAPTLMWETRSRLSVRKTRMVPVT